MGTAHQNMRSSTSTPLKRRLYPSQAVGLTACVTMAEPQQGCQNLCSVFGRCAHVGRVKIEGQQCLRASCPRGLPRERPVGRPFWQKSPLKELAGGSVKFLDIQILSLSSPDVFGHHMCHFKPLRHKPPARCICFTMGLTAPQHVPCV